MAMLVYGDWFHHVCIVVADGAVQASNPCGGVGGLGGGLVPPGGDVVVVVDGGGRLRLGWTTPPVDALVSGPELGANEARIVCAVASLGPKLSVAAKLKQWLRPLVRSKPSPFFCSSADT